MANPVHLLNMSSIAIISFIIILLAVLICYAFIAQTISQKKQQRERLHRALASRARNFHFILNGLPAGFLPKDLSILVQSCYIDVLESLAKLEPDNSDHKEELLGLTQRKSETQRTASSTPPSGTIKNPQQVREVKASLEELYKFIFQLESKGRVTKAQADANRATIKQLVLQLTIDSYVLHGRLSQEKDKLRLALHYFELGLNLMRRERASGLFEKRIEQLQAAIEEVKVKLAEQGDTAPAESEADLAISDEWEEFGKEEREWKKKQIYD